MGTALRPQFPQHLEFAGYPSSVGHLDNPGTGDFRWRITISHNIGDVHLLVQCHAPGKVDKAEHIVDAGRFPDHLLVNMAEIDPGPRIERGRARCWCGRGRWMRALAK